ncbi:MAG: VWA domain-containing protein [Candidatus Marinimicrobia bacterium]|nr:VWA domain-containing protein [Candidatus Neomarinimicrobiota bacterium]MCF7829711.1 VWA domain-containing protein [Candidatus Neomarinimicrobiota bacterium]MCF7881661.1 VWA domain-containing protein [Candidatus Neomarinimicrobiota bacterium]
MLRFGPPILWISFLSVPLLIGLYWYARRIRSRKLAEFGDSELVNRLTQSVNFRTRRIKRWLMIAGFFLLSVGMVAPKIGTSLAEVKRQGINLIFLLDTSLSMKAEDVKPNRLRRAKYESAQLIDRLRGDRVGLVAFAGVSYLQCPLTLDYGAAKMFLDVMDTDLIPSQGTAIGDAIETALGSFDTKETKHKALVIFSDGEDHFGKAVQAAEKAAEQGVVIYTVGVGTISGAPIPMIEDGNQGFKRDNQGKVVTTRLDPSMLQEISAITGGRYYQMGAGNYSADEVYEDIFQLERTELSSHQYTGYEERYQYFVAMALLLFIAEVFIPERKNTEPRETHVTSETKKKSKKTV